MKFIGFIFIISAVLGKICGNDSLSYSFTDCIDDYRSVVFSWNREGCSNFPPQPVDHISCDITCEPGTYLTYNVINNYPECSNCSTNTFSTGNTLRRSEKDKSWNDILKEMTRQCIWLESKFSIY